MDEARIRSAIDWLEAGWSATMRIARRPARRADLLHQCPSRRELGGHLRKPGRPMCRRSSQVSPDRPSGRPAAVGGRGGGAGRSPALAELPGLSGRPRPLCLHHQRLPLRPLSRHAGQGEGLSCPTGAIRRGSPIPTGWPTSWPTCCPRGWRAASARCPADSRREVGGDAADIAHGRQSGAPRRPSRPPRGPNRPPVRLALEPEPCCFLETVEETIRFFEDHLFSPRGPPRAGRIDRRAGGARAGACCAAISACASMSATPRSSSRTTMRSTGCSGPESRCPRSSCPRHSAAAGQRHAAHGAAGPFEDGVYLHQVVERGRRRPAPLSRSRHAAGRARQRRTRREWRVHFHVPVFLDAWATSRPPRTISRRSSPARRAPLRRISRSRPIPGACCPRPTGRTTAADIARELEWVKRELAA
jgi:hypothetical protein